VGIIKKLFGKDEAAPRSVAPAPSAYDPARAEAAYRRLLELAQELRRAGDALTAAQGRIELRQLQMRRSAEEYDLIAQNAIANGRSIQAESAIASAETAEAALAALEPQAQELAAQRAELAEAIANIESEAAAMRAKLDAHGTAQAVSTARATLHQSGAAMAGHRQTLDEVVGDAENETVRLEARARALAELYGAKPGEQPGAAP
jgi:phage shock protein A